MSQVLDIFVQICGFIPLVMAVIHAYRAAHKEDVKDIQTDLLWAIFWILLVIANKVALISAFAG